MKCAALLLAAAMLIAGASPAWAGEVAQFSVGGKAFELPLPDGFCLPRGDAADAAAALARADRLNVTDLTVVACDGQPFARDYFTIKTAEVFADVDLSRDRLLWLLTPANARGVTQGMNAGAIDQSGEILNGQTIRAERDGTIVTLGMDDFCIRQGGVVTLRGRDGAFVGVLGGCVTAVNERHMIVQSMGRGTTRAELERHVRFARTIAESIRPKP